MPFDNSVWSHTHHAMLYLEYSFVCVPIQIKPQWFEFNDPISLFSYVCHYDFAPTNPPTMKGILFQWILVIGQRFDWKFRPTQTNNVYTLSNPERMHRFRVFCHWLVNHSTFGNVILLCIMCSSALLAVEKPIEPPGPVNITIYYYEKKKNKFFPIHNIHDFFLPRSLCFPFAYIL